MMSTGKVCGAGVLPLGMSMWFSNMQEDGRDDEEGDLGDLEGKAGEGR